MVAVALGRITATVVVAVVDELPLIHHLQTVHLMGRLRLMVVTDINMVVQEQFTGLKQVN